MLTTLGTIALGQGLTSGITLASVPILLTAWGERVYGEWLILFALPAYLLLSDLGISNVAGTEMTMLVARGEQSVASRLFRSVFGVLLVLSSLVLVLGALSITFLPVRALFDLESLTQDDTVTILALFLVQVVVTLQSAILEAGFRAGGRYPTGALCRQLTRIAEVSCVPVAAILGAEPPVAAGVLAVVSLTGSIASWVTLLRFVPWLRLRLHRPDMVLLRPLWRPAIAYAAVPLATAVSLQGMVLVVGGVLGPFAVVVFQSARTLSRLPQGLMYAINQSVWPEVSSAFGHGDFALAQAIHRRAVQGAVALAVLAMLVLLPLGPPVIKLWTGGKVDVPYALFFGLIGSVSLNSLWYTSSVVLAATNRHARMAVLNLVGAAVTLGIAVVTLPIFGLSAAGVSLLAIDLLMIGYVLPHSLRLVQDHPRAFVRALLSRP